VVRQPTLPRSPVYPGRYWREPRNPGGESAGVWGRRPAKWLYRPSVAQVPRSRQSCCL